MLIEECVDASKSNNIISDDSGVSINSFNNFCHIHLNEDIEKTKIAVQKKLQWATRKLDKCNTVSGCIQFCNLIKSCADTLQALKHLDFTQNS